MVRSFLLECSHEPVRQQRICPGVVHPDARGELVLDDIGYWLLVIGYWMVDSG
jgi:hypothetical protein